MTTQNILEAKTRLEIIDHTETGTGRDYTKWVSKPFSVTLEAQDDGRTLKVVLEDIKEEI